MSKLILDFCDQFKYSEVESLAISLKLTKDQKNLLDSFKKFVTNEVKVKNSLAEDPKISLNDLMPQLIFNGLRQERGFFATQKAITKKTTKTKG